MHIVELGTSPLAGFDQESSYCYVQISDDKPLEVALGKESLVCLLCSEGSSGCSFEISMSLDSARVLQSQLTRVLSGEENER